MLAYPRVIPGVQRLFAGYLAKTMWSILKAAIALHYSLSKIKSGNEHQKQILLPCPAMFLAFTSLKRNVLPMLVL